MEQLSIFDVFGIKDDKPRDIPCGYLDDESLVGRELQFSELEGMIGKKVIISSNVGYKVVRIETYIKDHDEVYKKVRPIPEGCLQYGEYVNGYIHDIVGEKKAMECYELAYSCDRVGFADFEQCKGSRGWISEMYCNNGRHEPIDGPNADTFYELNI